jgi:uridylate kinase
MYKVELEVFCFSLLSGINRIEYQEGFMSKAPYKRVLLKLSGEILLGSHPFGLDPDACHSTALALQHLRSSSLEVGIVIGGGNIFRGKDLGALGLQRTPADHIGMLATLMNGIALQQALEKVGCPAKVMSALECPKVAETYTWSRAQETLREGKVLIFVGGTGNPYFTTDTAAALRASEMHADILLKATKVDGVYDHDPQKNPEARKYTTLPYSQYLAEKLQVMDATAVALCRSNRIPIFVFNMQLLKTNPDFISKPHLGTLIQGE